jgi:hypothetical protein
LAMSALPSEADIRVRLQHVCFRANSGLMRRRRVPLFDHLVDIGELLGQPRFAKTLNHQLRTF